MTNSDTTCATKALILNPSPGKWDVHVLPADWSWEHYRSLCPTGVWRSEEQDAYLDDNTTYLTTFPTRKAARAWCDENGYPWDWR